MSAHDLACRTIQALRASGVREFVLSPGSRNTPLSLELAAAEKRGELRLHVRIDERTAAFLALGLSKAGGAPAAVVSTSGTAVANFSPAVVEAASSLTPLAVVTANRPLGVLGTGANQTVAQLGIFGPFARSAVHLDDQRPEAWDDTLTRATTALRGAPEGPGPVQIDLGLTPPLVPTNEQRTSRDVTTTAGIEQDAAPVCAGAISPHPELSVSLPPRTLVVVAECDEMLAHSAVRAALDAGFPVHIEAGTALAVAEPGCLRAGAFLLRSALLEQARPEHLLVVGRPTLSRAIPALAAAVATTVVADDPSLTNPLQTGSPALQGSRLRIRGECDPGFAATWHRADDRAAAVLDAESEAGFDAGAVTALVAGSAPDLLVVASSNPIRDLDERARRRRQRVLVNRGAAGIDGLLSTAIGGALAIQAAEPAASATLLVGDLAFLHDHTALMIGPAEPRPDLTIVVVNNDGGAIFASLEQGAPEHAEHFERVFGTPTGVRIESLCAATSTPYIRCSNRAELERALGQVTTGIRVVEVLVSRDGERERRAALTARVLAAADDAARVS